MESLRPDRAWYSAESSRLGLNSSLCPFANIHYCPRYYHSLSLLGDYGCTKIDESVDERLLAFWGTHPLAPQTREQSTQIDSTGEGICAYQNFCPEVAWDRFGIFATYFSPYVDEVDRGLAHERLAEKEISSDDPRWMWRSLTPQHYAACPLYAPLARGVPAPLPTKRALPLGASAPPKEHFDVFISHASEDKDDFVRPLVDALTAMGLRVWYDERTLKLGDSLRQRIDNGLAFSDYGVVVLSRSFLAKKWTQAELDGLFARETQGRKVILPVWHNVTVEEVGRDWPLLAGKLAACSDEGVESVAKQILDAVQNDPPTSSLPVSEPLFCPSCAPTPKDILPATTR
jgi:hypothetical protein